MQSPLTHIIRDEQSDAVITADSRGIIKTWQAGTGQEGASYSTGHPVSALVQYSVDKEWFLTVGDIGVCPHLKRLLSKVIH